MMTHEMSYTLMSQFLQKSRFSDKRSYNIQQHAERLNLKRTYHELTFRVRTSKETITWPKTDVRFKQMSTLQSLYIVIKSTLPVKRFCLLKLSDLDHIFFIQVYCMCWNQNIGYLYFCLFSNFVIPYIYFKVMLVCLGQIARCFTR